MGIIFYISEEAFLQEHPIVRGKDAARLNTGPMSVEKDLGKIAREAIAEVKRERLSGEVK